MLSMTCRSPSAEVDRYLPGVARDCLGFVGRRCTTWMLESVNCKSWDQQATSEVSFDSGCASIFGPEVTIDEDLEFKVG